MRKKKEEPRIIEEKGFISEDESVMNLSACLNRIYRKVSSEGLTNDSLQELRNDIDYVAAFYHIDTPSSVLLAGILEKSATNNLMDDEDLANYLGCTNIEFIHYHEQLLNELMPKMQEQARAVQLHYTREQTLWKIRGTSAEAQIKKAFLDVGMSTVVECQKYRAKVLIDLGVRKLRLYVGFKALEKQDTLPNLTRAVLDLKDAVCRIGGDIKLER